MWKTSNLDNLTITKISNKVCANNKLILTNNTHVIVKMFIENIEYILKSKKAISCKFNDLVIHQKHIINYILPFFSITYNILSENKELEKYELKANVCMLTQKIQTTYLTLRSIGCKLKKFSIIFSSKEEKECILVFDKTIILLPVQQKYIYHIKKLSNFITCFENIRENNYNYNWYGQYPLDYEIIGQNCNKLIGSLHCSKEEIQSSNLSYWTFDEQYNYYNMLVINNDSDIALHCDKITICNDTDITVKLIFNNLNIITLLVDRCHSFNLDGNVIAPRGKLSLCYLLQAQNKIKYIITCKLGTSISGFLFPI